MRDIYHKIAWDGGMRRGGYTHGGFCGFMGNFVGNLWDLWANREEKPHEMKNKSKKKDHGGVSP